jgi:mono/diheme cytochrome c family protein
MVRACLPAAAVATLALLLGSGCGGGRAGDTGGSNAAQKKVALGQRVYQQQCATCHQAGGRGVDGVYPPLHETRWTTGDRGRLIRLVLHGMEGPVEVKGRTYDQVMQSRSYLSDQQVAAVLTYVRRHFGNDASAVQASEVAAVRAATAGRDGPWAPDALWQATGLPAAKADSSARDTTRRDTQARRARRRGDEMTSRRAP